jgi:uncharacterized protein YcfJ
MSKVQDRLQVIYKKSGTKNVAVEEVEDFEGELLNEGLLGAAGGAVLGHMATHDKKGAAAGAIAGHLVQKSLDEEDESEEVEDEKDGEELEEEIPASRALTAQRVGGDGGGGGGERRSLNPMVGIIGAGFGAMALRKIAMDKARERRLSMASRREEVEEVEEVEEGIAGSIVGGAVGHAAGSIVPGLGGFMGTVGGAALGHMAQKHIEKREEDESEDYEEDDEDKEVEEECVGPGMMKKENAKIKEQVMGALEREEASNKK